MCMHINDPRERVDKYNEQLPLQEVEISKPTEEYTKDDFIREKVLEGIKKNNG